MGSRGVDNFAMENGEKIDNDEKILARSGTTLSQVDLDILNKQNMVGDQNQVICKYMIFITFWLNKLELSSTKLSR